MGITTHLRAERCKPCEGGVAPMAPGAVQPYLACLSGWELSPDGTTLSREFVMKSFAAGIELMTEIASLAEEEGHHPDIHLTGYRKLRIDLSTHAIGGISMNDLIMAAKIDALSDNAP
ncbi:MAG TPA: pterin-4-alpha-carbinolamine dehydratase [Planctomycetes bacterium]|nr:pterin-4-alpha-carbinolamine dehydratase [Planctomycetota bacterium]